MDLSRPVPASRRGGFWPAPPQRRWWHHALAAPLVAAMGWTAFVAGERVLLLGSVDLAIHEFGHLVMSWLPLAVNLAMGSLAQLVLPAFVAWGLWFRSRDPLGAGLGLAWLGTSAQDVSVYVADAPFQRLPLIGGLHDWGTLLGPRYLDVLWAADDLAWLAWGVGLVAWTAGAVLVGWFGWRCWATRYGDGSDVEDPPGSWSTPMG